jgi:hypothetical protein
MHLSLKLAVASHENIRWANPANAQVSRHLASSVAAEGAAASELDGFGSHRPNLSCVLRSKSLASWRFVQLAGGVALHAVDHAAAAHRGALVQALGPAHHVRVGVHLQELAGLVRAGPWPAARTRARWPCRRWCSVRRPRRALRPAAVQHVHLALDFHGVAVDGVADLLRRIRVEVAETAAQVTARCPSARTASSGTRRAQPGSVGTKAPNFSARYSRMAPDSNTRTGCGPLWSTSAGILELGLIATKPLPNCSPWLMRTSQASYSAPVWPAASSSSSITVTLTPFGRTQRIQLQRVFADRQFLVVRGAGHGAVDVGKPAAAAFGRGPDLGGDVGDGVVHARNGARNCRDAHEPRRQRRLGCYRLPALAALQKAYALLIFASFYIATTDHFALACGTSYSNFDPKTPRGRPRAGSPLRSDGHELPDALGLHLTARGRGR